MKDIQTQQDLYLLVNQFYKKLLSDKSISYIFTDIVKIKIEEHLPILVTFWSQMILGTGGHTNNLTDIHLKIDKLSHLSSELFEIWLMHFNSNVNELFEGENDNKVMAQAQQLAMIMQIKIDYNRI